MDNDSSRVVERLIEKACEAFILSIELYNRPSIKYRVEGFSFFICNAWELMLKAKIVKERGIESIYYKDNPNRTLALDQCIGMVFTNDKDPLRRNLEDIIRLRNTSTHFIVEEHEQIYVGLFQSCVSNFDDKMFEYHGVRTSDKIPPHFLTLSMTPNPATPEAIRAKYTPDIAEKFLFDENEIAQEQLLQANQKYSTVMITELAIVKDKRKADFLVAHDSSADKSIRIAKIIQDPSNTHPLSVSKVLEHVNKRLAKGGVSLMAGGEPKSFTTNDWKLFMRFYDFKSQQKYAYKHIVGKTESYTYSMATVDFILSVISDSPDTIIDDLKNALKNKNETTPGAKDSKQP